MQPRSCERVFFASTEHRVARLHSTVNKRAALAPSHLWCRRAESYSRQSIVELWAIKPANRCDAAAAPREPRLGRTAVCSTVSRSCRSSRRRTTGLDSYYLQRTDRTFERQPIARGFANRLKPSQYFRCQMWATYIEDFVGVANRHFIGVDKLMWSSDYPHQASCWPHRRRSSPAISRTRVPRTSSRSPTAKPRGSTASTPERPPRHSPVAAVSSQLPEGVRTALIEFTAAAGDRGP